jgi:hypothetical protein
MKGNSDKRNDSRRFCVASALDCLAFCDGTDHVNSKIISNKSRGSGGVSRCCSRKSQYSGVIRSWLESKRNGGQS